MPTKIEIAKQFINHFFKIGGSWDKDVAPYVAGDGEQYYHALKIPSLKICHELLHGVFRESFPDLMQTIESIGEAEDGTVLVFTRSKATFAKDFGDHKANGLKWDIPVYWQLSIENGKVVAAREDANHLLLNKQMGMDLVQLPDGATLPNVAK